MSAATMNELERLQETSESMQRRIEATENDRYELQIQLDAALEREQALAAHVVQLMGALGLARDRMALLAETATKKGADVYAALDMWPKEMEQVLAEQPTTTLTKRDLIKQAEALEFCAKSVSECDERVSLHGISVAIKMHAKDLRQQAAALNTAEEN